SRLERAHVGDRELRAVLEEERDAVAGTQAARAQPAREAIGALVQLAVADLAAVEDERGAARVGARVARQERGQRVCGQPDGGLVEARRPEALPGPVHVD